MSTMGILKNEQQYIRKNSTKTEKCEAKEAYLAHMDETK